MPNFSEAESTIGVKNYISDSKVINFDMMIDIVEK